MFIHRKHLPTNHVHHELPRRSDRRKTEGIYAQAWSLSPLKNGNTGDQAHGVPVDTIGRLGAEVSGEKAQEVSDE